MSQQTGRPDQPVDWFGAGLTPTKPFMAIGAEAPAAPEPRSYANRIIGGAAMVAVTGICLLLSWHVVYKAATLPHRGLTIVYTLVVGTYVISRFIMAAFYRQPKDVGIFPTVAIIVPAFNEGAAVRQTVDAVMVMDYPADLVECIVIDDGSQDDTYEHMQTAAAQYPAGRVQCIKLGRNLGKRAAMAAGIRASTAEILVFVDSDSHPARDGVRLLVQAFADRRVGAVSGITFARNARTNTLTRMQAARYFVSFQLLKSAESVIGAVTCCSGCFSAYRRAAVDPLLDAWEHQRFLGTACSYGDDRALTNRVIETGWRSVYHSGAQAWTDVPSRYAKFFRQQLRWKKSWARESVLLLGHIWRSRPVAFPFILVATAAGLLSPIVMIANLFGRTLIAGILPVVYLTGLYLVAMCYGLFHRTWRDDRLWPYAILGTAFYLLCSVQLVWALARLRDGTWGTRNPGQPTSGIGPMLVPPQRAES
jgi:hyaluronan synthase